MKTPKLIITHDGTFHADEVFAIALIIHALGPVPVARRRMISEDEVKDPSVWIIDVGRLFEPKSGNFDHHQDINSSASNILIMDHLLKNKAISEDFVKEIRNEFKIISNIDRFGYSDSNGFQVNSLIRSFNHIPNGWETAVEVALIFLKSKQSTLDKEQESETIWEKGNVVGMHTKVCNAFPIFWKRYKEQPYLVVPLEEHGVTTWQLHSMDSAEYPITRTGTEIFYHSARFLSVYRTLDDALEASKESIKIKLKTK